MIMGKIESTTVFWMRAKVSASFFDHSFTVSELGVCIVVDVSSVDSIVVELVEAIPVVSTDYTTEGSPISTTSHKSQAWSKVFILMLRKS